MRTEPALPVTRPWAAIDRAAITHNLAWLRRRLHHPGSACSARLWAVVKADAYGHGLGHVLSALSEADGLCIADLQDAHRLRRHGWHRPILLLSACGLNAAELLDPALGELHVVVDDEPQLVQLERLTPQRSSLHAWLRYAGRLRSHGFEQPDYDAAFARLNALVEAGVLAQAGHMHHYAAAEDPAVLAQERQEFAAAVGHLPGPRNTGNSAALSGNHPETIHPAGHWLRCGLLLYGASALPGTTGAQLGLRPAMSLRAPLLAVRRVKAGQTIGYGDSFRSARDTCIGIVGIGYGHGIPRALWQHGRVLAGPTGRCVPLAGRVAMDSLAVDLGPAAPEQPGEAVTLWGRCTSGALLPVETAAGSCDTIAAELFTSLTARVPLTASGASHFAGG